MARPSNIDNDRGANCSVQSNQRGDRDSCVARRTLPSVEIKSPDGTPTIGERGAMVQAIDRCGAVCYRLSDRVTDPRDAIRRLSHAMGLLHPDQLVRHGESGITDLREESKAHPDRVRESSANPRYSTYAASYDSTGPHDNDDLCWHTDGCHNPADRPVRTFLLHCISTAAHGGDYSLMDSDVALALVSDLNRDAAQLLSHPKAMTVPAYKIDDVVIRPDRAVPVFKCERVERYRPDLLMRFTTDHRHLIWRNEDTAKAAMLLVEVIDNATAHHYQHALEPNVGIISRNILHKRQAFVDSDKSTRHILRACFYDRITNPADEFSAPRFGI